MVGKKGGLVMKNMCNEAKKWLLCAMLLIGMHPLLLMSSQDNEQWTWLYHKMITSQEKELLADKKEVMFQKETDQSFSQLMFSWNAFRPEQGHFSFWVQARDAERHTWGTWHKMAEWGNQVQMSYATPGDGHTKYEHVRLESQRGRKSDAFRIRIVAHEGAPIDLIQSCTICVSDFTKFNAEDAQSLGELPSIKVRKVPKYSQFLLDHPRKDGLCSPTSCSMLTAYILQNDIDPVGFAEHAYDTGLGVYGSWPFNMAHAFERCGGSWRFSVARFASFKVLHGWIQRGIPVVVSVRGPLKGAATPYSQGHLLVVVGWDARSQEVICHDPAFSDPKKVRMRYAAADFLSAWERSRRLVYLADPLPHNNESIK
jgi:hypothetical protein